MAYSNLRIGGLASGIDIDQIVSDLMKVERMRVDKLYQQRQIMEWQKQDYRDINLKLKVLYDNVFNMKLQGTYLKYKATGTVSTTGASADMYFTATAGSTAVPGDYTVRVDQLASGAKIESLNPISKPLESRDLNNVIIDENNNKFIISIDGVERTIILASGTYDFSTLGNLAMDIQQKINDIYGQDKISVTIIGSKLVIQPGKIYNLYKPSIVLKNSPTNNALDNLGFDNESSYKINPYASLKTERSKFVNDPLAVGEIISFKINEQTFTFDLTKKDYSLNEILAEINSNDKANVYAYYDNLTDKVVLKSKNTGLDASVKVDVSSGSGNLFGASGALQIGNSTEYGKNARIILNSNLVIENPSNSFILNGIQFNLKKSMDTTDPDLNLKIEPDIDGVVENIKNFINLYNDTIDAINKKLSEERYRDYPPLTDAQKKEMKEDEIKLWEEKAKSGLLRSDPLLSGIVDKMRQAVYTPVSGLPAEFDSLYDIGITTGSYQEKGKLYLDENKLREALSKDLNAVMNLFTVTDENDSTKNGIAVNLYDILKSGIKSITDKAGGGDFQIYDNSVLARQIRDINERIDSMEEQLKNIEDRYWRQFTEMEKAISAMNQQSMWLASQLGLYGSQS